MTVAWPNVVPLDDSLLCRDVPAGAVFLDTNALNETTFANRVHEVAPPLVSSVVYAERLTRLVDRNARVVVEAELLQRRIRVVPLDATDIAFYALLMADFLAAERAANTARRVFGERLRRIQKDLLIFATALRHRKPLVTVNVRDFAWAPHPGTYESVASFVNRAGW